jgi:serine/threonine protein kinase
VVLTAPVLSDHFRIERQLGAGGMATVYLAEDVRHRRKVAVKVLRPELGRTLAADRFLREIEIIAQMLHPHILSLLDSGETDGALFYVMPYIAGGSLRGKLERSGELPVAEAVGVIRSVADALAYAHQRGVVHRDIKPENVLLLSDDASEKGNRPHVLVADFGIAKAVWTAAQGGDAHESTTEGMALGTPAYMAPEQAAGDLQVDQRADIYALGLLAYELLTGAPPFSGSTPQQLMAAHVARLPEALSKRRSAVPPALDHIVMRCLEKRPADRWQSADEIMRRLDALAASTGDTPSSVGPKAPSVADGTFALSESVCRYLTRETLDPRVIGDVVRYRDNRVDSEVLVVLIPGCGLDHRQFEPVLLRSPYRMIAVTPYGFEPSAPRRIPLALDDHGTIVRALLADVIAREQPAVTILAGFSSGADLVMRLLARGEPKPNPRVDGVLALGPNLGIDTCFATRVLATVSHDPARMLEDLQRISSGSDTVEGWVGVHEYLVQIVRKFRSDLTTLHRFASEIVEPFERHGESPFIGWYRRVSARAGCIRCVFDDAPEYVRLLHDIQLRNLDSGILGDHYQEGSLRIESRVNHFELIEPDRLVGYLEPMVAALKRA